MWYDVLGIRITGTACLNGSSTHKDKIHQQHQKDCGTDEYHHEPAVVLAVLFLDVPFFGRLLLLFD